MALLNPPATVFWGKPWTLVQVYVHVWSFVDQRKSQINSELFISETHNMYPQSEVKCCHDSCSSIFKELLRTNSRVFWGTTWPVDVLKLPCINSYRLIYKSKLLMYFNLPFDHSFALVKLFFCFYRAPNQALAQGSQPCKFGPGCCYHSLRTVRLTALFQGSRRYSKLKYY